MEAFVEAQSLFQELPNALSRRTKVQRLLSDHFSHNDRLERSFERVRAELPSWLHVKEVSAPSIIPDHVERVIEVEPAWVVDLAGLCSYLRETLFQANVTVYTQAMVTIKKMRVVGRLMRIIERFTGCVIGGLTTNQTFFPHLKSQIIWGHLLGLGGVNDELDILVEKGT